MFLHEDAFETFRFAVGPFCTTNTHRSKIERRGEEVDFVVNVLASDQAALAAAYAKPGTPPLAHPQERLDGEGEEVHPLNEAGLVEVEGEGRMPVVKGSLGAFGCQVVDTVDLSKYGKGDQDAEGVSRSILYIAKVVHVHTEATSLRGETTTPLIYHRQKFVSTTNTPLT